MSTVQLDTPPPTPTEEKDFWNKQTPVLKKRQSRSPVQTPNKQPDMFESNSAVINFELQLPRTSGSTPSLAINSSATGRRKVRRRLWDVCEPLEHVDLDIRKRKRPTSLHGHQYSVNRKLICSVPLSYYNGTDADDEMERSQLNDASFLSPPYSPCFTEPVTHSTSDRDSSQPLIHCSRAQQVPRVKACVSCKTKKTPLWRDSEDGTPYCNACGIRLRKYHISCSVCRYIPRKDEKLNNCCCLCGSRLVHC